MTIKAEKNKLMYFFLALTMIAGSGIGYSKLYLFHVIGIYGLLVLFVQNYTVNPGFRIKSKYLYFIAFLFFNLATLTWTLNKTFTLYQIFYLTVGFSIIILTNALADHGKLNYLIIPIVIGIVIGIIESLGIARWPLSPYSENISLFGRSFKGAALVSPVTIPTIYFGNPNDLCLALNYLLCFVLFLRKRILKIFSTAVIIFIISRTGSRGGQVTSLFVLLFYLLFYIKIFRLVSILTLPVVGIGFYLFFQRVIERFNIDYLLDFSYAGMQNSIGIRQQLYLNCFNFLGENGFNLLLGAGGGASKQIHILADNTFGIYSTHFFLLEILTDYGIIVFTLIIMAYLFSVFKMFKVSRLKIKENKLAGAVFLALLTTLPGSISSSSIIYFFPFWIILGFTVYYLKNYRRLSEYPATR